MKKGLIVGKFYPPHKGHKYLIETGLKNVDHLTVVVCWRRDEFIPGELRAKWIKKMHPNVHVLHKNVETYDPHNPKLWASLAREWLGFTPEVVFTSEHYGDLWAKALGCKHFLVDLERKTVPVSGTKVRENPKAYLAYLEPQVQEYFSSRIE